MKHRICGLLLWINFSLCAEGDSHIADKSKRIGRFSYEDSFDESLVENILKHAPSAVKKNIKRLLYPSESEDIPQRLLLLGGTSNAVTAAIAKTIALRCGYEYYVINAAALLREYREGRQMLLNEVRPIIKSGKPIALIITELPEMADYSGLLASTLWLLIDQCAQYEDVLVIGTSAFEREKLSGDVRERFGENIVPVVFDKGVESTVIKQTSWWEKNRMACVITGSFAFVGVFAGLQFYLVNLLEQQRQENEKKLSDMKSAFDEEKISVEKDLQVMQNQQVAIRQQQVELESERNNLKQQNIELNQKVDRLNEQERFKEIVGSSALAGATYIIWKIIKPF